jgi:hypothetical protein
MVRGIKKHGDGAAKGVHTAALSCNLSALKSLDGIKVNPFQNCTELIAKALSLAKSTIYVQAYSFTSKQYAGRRNEKQLP